MSVMSVRAPEPLEILPYSIGEGSSFLQYTMFGLEFDVTFPVGDLLTPDG